MPLYPPIFTAMILTKSYKVSASALASVVAVIRVAVGVIFVTCKSPHESSCLEPSSAAEQLQGRLWHRSRNRRPVGSWLLPRLQPLLSALASCDTQGPLQSFLHVPPVLTAEAWSAVSSLHCLYWKIKLETPSTITLYRKKLQQFRSF